MDIKVLQKNVVFQNIERTWTIDMYVNMIADYWNLQCMLI